MSPYAALHSPIFLIYAVLTLGILALAGFALAIRQRSRDVSAVWITYRSWLVIESTASSLSRPFFCTW